jgi:hypothetical protein
MVEGRGIRDWEEGIYLFRSEDRETAFVRALEIGEGGQSGGEEEGRHTRWVETRLAEVVTLDCLGSELEEEPLEVHWMRLPATEKIAFDHKFEPAKKAPPVSRCRLCRPIFLEEPALRSALNARPTASQGFATAGLLQKNRRERISERPSP